METIDETSLQVNLMLRDFFHERLIIQTVNRFLIIRHRFSKFNHVMSPLCDDTK
ncbi:hypothetical protein L479_02373 [Exiguobacterium sp. S17]|nr:hypothetical protein L479_02373 [Exiguobacterium sp. S17]